MLTLELKLSMKFPLKPGMLFLLLPHYRKQKNGREKFVGSNPATCTKTWGYIQSQKNVRCLVLLLTTISFKGVLVKNSFFSFSKVRQLRINYPLENCPDQRSFYFNNAY